MTTKVIGYFVIPMPTSVRSACVPLYIGNTLSIDPILKILSQPLFLNTSMAKIKSVRLLIWCIGDTSANTVDISLIS